MKKAYYKNLATLGGQLNDWKDCADLTKGELFALSQDQRIQLTIINKYKNKFQNKTRITKRTLSRKTSPDQSS